MGYGVSPCRAATSSVSEGRPRSLDTQGADITPLALSCDNRRYIRPSHVDSHVTETQHGRVDEPTASLSTLEQVIVVLVGITAVTHIYPGIVEGAPPLVLAGLGFLGGGALYVYGVRRRALAVAAIPYTAVQIPLWVVIKAGNYTLVGYVDKAVQVALVAALVVLVVGWFRD